MMTGPRAHQPRVRTRAFSLVEALAVIVIMGILAAATLPAFDSLSAARHAAAADEVGRLLAAARSHAMTTGQTTGLGVSTSDSTVQLWTIETSGASPTPPDELSPASRHGSFGDSEILSASIESTDDTIWFRHDGSPRLRDSSGDAGAMTTDADIALTGGWTVTVRAGSGMIERAGP